MTREEQIELVKECMKDAFDVIYEWGCDDPSTRTVAIIAAAFFPYRAGQRDAADIPGNTPDNAASVDED